MYRWNSHYTHIHSTPFKCVSQLDASTQIFTITVHGVYMNHVYIQRTFTICLKADLLYLICVASIGWILPFLSLYVVSFSHSPSLSLVDFFYSGMRYRLNVFFRMHISSRWLNVLAKKCRSITTKITVSTHTKNETQPELETTKMNPYECRREEMRKEEKKRYFQSKILQKRGLFYNMD